MEPRALAALAERDRKLPRGDDERFAGYGVFGVGFESGDLLAMRRFPAASVGPGYSSVWHRDPQGKWTILSDVAPEQGCARYFGSELESAPRARIDVTWTGPRAFTVSVEGTLQWDLTLRPTLATRMLNGMGRMMPDALWRNPGVLGVMARMAGPMLGAGRLTLTGRTPNGQGFVANPLHVWRVAQSRARWEGRDLGRVVALDAQPALGGFRIPSAPLFSVGRTFFDAYDAGAHSRATTRGEVERLAAR